MSDFAAKIYVDGTAARKFERPARKQARIISFPEERRYAHRHAAQRRTGTISDVLVSVLRRSEMACSLLFETCAGCAYRLFSHNQMLVFSFALVTLLAAGIVLGV